jgi:hypothetical protein
MTKQREVVGISPADEAVLKQGIAYLLTTVQSNAGRIVALGIPFLTAIITAGAVWLQNVIGIDMQKHVPEIVAFIVMVATSALASGVVWLRNKGHFEAAAAVGLTNLHLTVLDHANRALPPASPAAPPAPQGQPVGGSWDDPIVSPDRERPAEYTPPESAES